MSDIVDLTRTKRIRNKPFSMKEWTPREVLQYMIDIIDSGEKAIDNVVIIYECDGKDGVGYERSCKEYNDAVAMTANGLFLMQHAMFIDNE